MAAKIDTNEVIECPFIHQFIIWATLKSVDLLFHSHHPITPPRGAPMCFLASQET